MAVPQGEQLLGTKLGESLRSHRVPRPKQLQEAMTRPGDVGCVGGDQPGSSWWLSTWQDKHCFKDPVPCAQGTAANAFPMAEGVRGKPCSPHSAGLRALCGTRHRMPSLLNPRQSDYCSQLCQQGALYRSHSNPLSQGGRTLLVGHSTDLTGSSQLEHVLLPGIAQNATATTTGHDYCKIPIDLAFTVCEAFFQVPGHTLNANKHCCI